jgi:hypothetical protein
MDAQGFVGYHLERWGGTPLEVIGAFLSRPVDLVRDILARDRLHYVYGLLQPTLFLPVPGNAAWILGVPQLAINVLSEHQYMRQVLKYYAIIPALFAFVATARTAARLAGARRRPERAAAGPAVALVVLMGLIPALVLNRPPEPRPSPPAAPARAVLDLVPRDAAVYAPVGLYPHLANRESVAVWESLGERILMAEERARYDWIVLWPEGDPPGERRDARVAEALAEDATYQQVDGFAPLLVYRRR